MKYEYDKNIRRFVSEFTLEDIDYWLESPFADCSSTFIKIIIVPKKSKDLRNEGRRFYVYNLVDNQYTNKYGYGEYPSRIKLGNDNSNAEVWIEKDSYVYDAKFDKFIQEFVSEIRDEVVVNSLIDN